MKNEEAQALEQEPDENCSDCVHINESEPTIDNCACCTDMCNYQRKTLSVTPTRKVGKWIKLIEYLVYIIAFIVGWIIGDSIYSIL